MKILLIILAVATATAIYFKLTNKKGMAPSNINLSLLAKVPFFQKFTKEELLWVKDNASEFHFSKREILKPYDTKVDAYWILLDGGWEISSAINDKSELIEHSLTSFVSPNISESANSSLKVVISESSYILKISPEKMIQLKKMQPLVTTYIQEGEIILNNF